MVCGDKLMQRFIAIVLAVCLTTIGAGAAAAAGPAGSAIAGDSMTHKDIAKVKQATAQYHDVAAAMADGFVQVSPYVPGMGYHYSNFGPIDPYAPNTLVYAERGNGDLKLVAVEYVSDDPFTVFGQDGTFNPITGHYDLHVWVWQANPDGIFAPFNPNVN